MASSVRAIASSIASALAILTETTVVLRRPYIDSNVVNGISTKPSNDCPSTRPFFAMTPFTVSSYPATRTVLPDGRPGSSKSSSGDVPAQHDRVPPLVDVGVGERRAEGEAVVLHQLVRCRDAEDQHVRDGAVAGLHVAHRRRPAGLERHGLGIGQRLRHHLGVFAGDQRPLGDRLQLLVVEQADGDGAAPDLEGVGADHRAGEVLPDVGVHALDDRDHDDEKAHRDDDAEEREEGAQLGAEDRLEGEAEGFGRGAWAGTVNGHRFTVHPSAIRTSAPPPDPAATPCWRGRARTARR